jgi:hypothetical protein
LELVPHGHIARFVDQFSWETLVNFEDFRGLLKVKVSGRVAATAIQQRGSEFATVPVAVLDGAVAFSGRDDPVPLDSGDGLANQLFFAQFGDGSGLISQILLFNLNPEEPADTRVDLRDDDGDPLATTLNNQSFTGTLDTEVPAGGVKILESDGLASSVSVGSAVVSSDRPLAGVILFSSPFGVAGVASSEATSVGFVAPMQVHAADTINTGFAVMNLEDDEIQLDLALKSQSGALLAESQLDLPPLGHKALFVNDLQWDKTVNFDDFRGLLVADSNGKRIAATVLQARFAKKQYATMPVTERAVEGTQ